jgi:hypothetical protein
MRNGSQVSRKLMEYMVKIYNSRFKTVRIKKYSVQYIK